jgi:hypothetical protein
MWNLLINKLYQKLQPFIDTQITDRIVTFHQALLNRGQIKPCPKEPVNESLIHDCKADSVPQ